MGVPVAERTKQRDLLTKLTPRPGNLWSLGRPLSIPLDPVARCAILEELLGERRRYKFG